jgi:SagB-type dehydrogenase family enzyme
MEASLRAISGVPMDSMAKSIDIRILAEILFFSAGLTRKVRVGNNAYYMRAAPATGALYPIELYVVCGEIAGLEAGVFHFNPLNFSLVRLRDGDYRTEIGAISGEGSSTSPVTIALTSLAWRNAWKYEARSYRHWFWDSGVIVANLLATTASEGLVPRVVVGFVDSEVDRLLGLEAEKEATVALAQIGLGLDGQAGHFTKAVSTLSLDVEPLSKAEADYPIIWVTNKASALHSSEEVRVWRSSLKPHVKTIAPAPADFQRPEVKGDLDFTSTPPLGEVILRRGSTRRFVRQPISFEHLSAVLKASASEIPLDFLRSKETLVDFYFIANDVGGLPSGSYYFHSDTECLEQLKTGAFRNVAGYLCLEQPLFSDAAAVFFLMTDLQHVLGLLGDRGYRAAQFEAGIRAGKMYLSSYSQGIGASGSTFYDDAATEFFSPHAKDKSTMKAVGIGVPAYVARSGSVLP